MQNFLSFSVNFFFLTPYFLIFYMITILFFFNFFKYFVVFFKNDVNMKNMLRQNFLKTYFQVFKTYLFFFYLWLIIINDRVFIDFQSNLFFFYTHIYYFFTFILFVLIKLNNWYEFKNFDQLYSYNLMIYYPPVILFFDNIINLFFSIELLNLLIFYNLIANFNKNTQSNWKLVNVSTSYFYSLLFLCIINFFANILFFFSLNYLVFYTNSVSLNYWNWFFDNFFNSIVLKKIDLFHQSNFFVIFFLSSFFLKLSLGPVSLLKLELYKNINLWTIIFYSTIYMYIIMLVIFKKFFFLC